MPMFKDAPSIPILADLGRGRFMFRDRRRMSQEDKDATSDVFGTILQNMIVLQKPKSLGLCSHGPSEADMYNKRVDASGVSREDLAQWMEDNPYAPTDDMCMNPEMGSLTLGVYTGSPKIICGLVNLYNIELESEVDMTMRIAVSFAPAFSTPENGELSPLDCKEVMEILLERDLREQAMPQRTVDIVEWKFGTDGDADTNRAWVYPNGKPFESLRHLIDRDHNYSTRDRGGLAVPKSLRRKNAPAKNERA